MYPFCRSDLPAHSVIERVPIYLVQYVIGRKYIMDTLDFQLPMIDWKLAGIHIGAARKYRGMTGGRGARLLSGVGKRRKELHPGDVVAIPAGVKHWHPHRIAGSHIWLLGFPDGRLK